jgi:hypothetical protein
MVGAFATADANQTLYWQTVFSNAALIGPIAVAANFAGAEGAPGGHGKDSVLSRKNARLEIELVLPFSTNYLTLGMRNT